MNIILFPIVTFLLNVILCISLLKNLKEGQNNKAMLKDLICFVLLFANFAIALKTSSELVMSYCYILTGMKIAMFCIIFPIFFKEKVTR